MRLAWIAVGLALAGLPVAADAPDGRVDSSRDDEAPEPCGFFEQPCWTARLACYYVGPPLARLLPGSVYCPTQPGSEGESPNILSVG